MEDPVLAPSEDHGLGPRDVRAIIAMIDYLIVDISPVDAMAAYCLMLARTSLMEFFDASQRRTH